MKNDKKSTPEINEATRILNEAEILNPGPWVKHSIHVAESAKLIAEKMDTLNPELAYVLGLLHDIGRREGVHGMRHGLDGYKYASKRGYDLVAQICLSHTALEYKNKIVIVGNWDGSEAEYDFAIEYLNSTVETEYDKLIKLCDCVSLPSGFCMIEKRLVDIGMRSGINEYTLPRWKSTFEIKKYFEEKIGKSIYDLLPNVKENTFST